MLRQLKVQGFKSIADQHGFPHAIVGYVDLGGPDVCATLDRELASGRLRGIRQQLHWHEKTLYRFAPRPDLMIDPAWRAGLREFGDEIRIAWRHPQVRLGCVTRLSQ